MPFLEATWIFNFLLKLSVYFWHWIIVHVCYYLMRYQCFECTCLRNLVIEHRWIVNFVKCEISPSFKKEYMFTGENGWLSNRKTYRKYVQLEQTTEILKSWSWLTSNHEIEGIIVYVGSAKFREEKKKRNKLLFSW